MTTRRALVRTLTALGLAGGLALGGALAATAAVTAPTPDSGPVAGNTTVLVPEPESLTFSDASQGSGHALAVGSDGILYAWGTNGSGQLGNGTTTTSSTPVPVTAPAGVTLSDPSASYNWSLAIGSDGGVYSWGFNQRGQLGNGTLNTGSTIPTPVLTPAGITFSQTETGEYSSWALGSDGQVYAWGRLVGTSTDASVPVPMSAPGGATFTQISGGNGHILALASDGNAYAWGSNGFGQLGNGSYTASGTPVPVSAPAGVTFTQVVAGGYFSLALGSDGKTYAWGYNDAGQLGVGGTTQRNVPTEVLVPAGVTFTSLGAGYDTAFATTAGGETYGWGANAFRQIGDGTNISRQQPVLVQSPVGVALDAPVANDNRSVAVGDDGKLYAWSIVYGPAVPTLFWPTVTVTGISFDGIPGTGVAYAGDGDWSVVTPAHAAGPVDVVVEWTLNGVVQTPITYVDGYTYVEEPTITDPTDATVLVGTPATFSVDVTGYPDPTVTWEYSTDGGSTWLPIAGDTDAVVSGDGLSVTVTPGSIGHDGYLYRATATNSVGSATSEAAELTVTPETSGTDADADADAGAGAATDADATGTADAGAAADVEAGADVDAAGTADAGAAGTADASGTADPGTATPGTGGSAGSGATSTPSSSGDSGLAQTGGETPLVAVVLGALALIVGAVLLHSRRELARRRG